MSEQEAYAHLERRTEKQLEAACRKYRLGAERCQELKESMALDTLITWEHAKKISKQLESNSPTARAAGVLELIGVLGIRTIKLMAQMEGIIAHLERRLAKLEKKCSEPPRQIRGRFSDLMRRQ
jgi:hypothetical protein